MACAQVSAHCSSPESSPSSPSLVVVSGPWVAVVVGPGVGALVVVGPVVGPDVVVVVDVEEGLDKPGDS